eukprot:2996123-Rhodomonas_salina.5
MTYPSLRASCHQVQSGPTSLHHARWHRNSQRRIGAWARDSSVNFTSHHHHLLVSGFRASI